MHGGPRIPYPSYKERRALKTKVIAVSGLLQKGQMSNNSVLRLPSKIPLQPTRIATEFVDFLEPSVLRVVADSGSGKASYLSKG